RIPAKMTLLMPQWVVHRDPRWWDRPDAFDPSRWDHGLMQKLPKFAYYPFGGGGRLCIGNNFAMMESVLSLATIAQRYHFTVVPNHVVVPGAAFTLRPLTGILAVLKR